MFVVVKELRVTTFRFGVFNIDDHWWVYGAEKWSGPFDNSDTLWRGRSARFSAL